MINIFKQGFSSKQEAELWRDTYYRNWHPAGYGTVINIEQEPDGSWTARGRRGSSCD